MSEQDQASEINVGHLARLARLSLSDEQNALATADLNNIITMIDAMQAVDTDGVEPMASPIDATQRLREDEITERVNRDEFQATAPRTRDGYYLVPRVVE